MHAPASATVDYDQVRSQYLSKIPPGPTVDGGKARDLQNFFATPMGKVILDYFESLATSKFNYYGLSDENFRLWFAIKMLAKNDSNMYLRSLAADKNLFVEFVKKAYNIG